MWDEPPVVVERADGVHGEVVLRRRGLGPAAHWELIVNGAFAMDSVETGTERELAELALARLGADQIRAARVLVGGLGLGFTAEALLDRGVGGVHVVELEPALVRWAGEAITPRLDRVATDDRCHLHVADLADVVAGRAGPAGPWDAVVLDVDNGPDFLLHAENAPLYEEPSLAAVLALLRPSGRLVVWCQGLAPDLLAALQALDPDAAEHVRPVRRGGRMLTYALYTASTRGATDRGSRPG